MLIDSKSKMIFNDYNPEKRTCQYKPCSAIGKHKACGECKYVRYCVSTMFDRWLLWLEERR